MKNMALFLGSVAALAVSPVDIWTPAAAQAVIAPEGGQTAPTLSDQAVTDRANALLARMTPAEKAGQLFNVGAISFTGDGPPPIEDAIARGEIGAIFMASDPAKINRFQRIALERSRLKIPLLVSLDVIHGFQTIFPVPLGLAASWDPALVTQVQSVAAKEARAAGIHWTFAPNVDIARDPRWGRMVEGAGEDPYLGSAMAVAQVRGFQGSHVGAPGHLIAGPKHLAGYGAALGGRDYDEVNLSDSELWNVYLPPFKAAVDAGAYNIMSAYMALNGVPAAANRWLLTDVLRKTWGFKGFVVTDAVSVPSLITHGLALDRADAATRALNAGVAMELGLPNGAFAHAAGPKIDGSTFATLPDAVSRGLVSPAALDNAARQVLEAKIRMGLFEKPYVDEAAAARVAADPGNRILARVAAERSAVLLRNDDALLPLDIKRIKSMAVIGPLADSAVDTDGPWVLKPKSDAVTILAGLRAKVGSRVSIDYVDGVRIPPRAIPRLIDPPAPTLPPFDDDAGIARAVEAARKADVAIVVVGEKLEMSGENASRATLDLPGRQQELLDAVVATGKPVVVLLINGRPLDLKGTRAKALLELWYPGSEGGNAAANLLFGDATPGGKLPFSWPRSVGQVPLIYSHLASHVPGEAAKRYWDEPGTPAWPFGHGLSYSTFRYSNLHVDRASVKPEEDAIVSVTVSNEGSRAADEVVQLYIHQRSGAARPVRELKGFERITLAPGASRVVRFRVGPRERRYWSAVTHDWVQDASSFDVWVGGDSGAPLATTFAVQP